MNSEPIYNEPGYTDLQGTPEGNVWQLTGTNDTVDIVSIFSLFYFVLQDRSAEYNARLHPYTVRYAMLDQLRHPPQGTHLISHHHSTGICAWICRICTHFSNNVSNVSPSASKKYCR